MNWTEITGHQAQQDMLRRAIHRDRMAHAWLFAGPTGIGKSLFARAFAQSLFCERHADTELQICGACSSCRQMEAGTHPDFFHIRCPEGKSEIPVEVFYGKAEQRGREGLIHDLALRPMSARRRIALIDDANRMNDEGANAMLKTLEEPPADSLLILIADNLEAILPTIRSRCQVLRFAPLPESAVCELLLSTGQTSDAAEAAAVAGLSEGSLAVASQLLNPALRSLRERLFRLLSGSDLNPLEATRTLSEGLEAFGTETSEQRRGTQWLIRFAEEFFRRATLVLSGQRLPGQSDREVAHFAARMTPQGVRGLDRTIEMFDRCLIADGQIDTNISPVRVLECLFSELAAIARQSR